MQSKSVIRSLFMGLTSLVIFSHHLGAQDSAFLPRITGAIDETKLTVLKGNTYPRARTQFDRGPAPSTLALNRILLVLQRTLEQESSLKSLLDQQQQKSSANYHKWLTPEEFGQQFGAADQDIHRITSWLSSHGFQIGNVAKNKLIIEFSGTAGRVNETFHTEIHRYEVDGKQYWANSTDPAIPTALTPVVAGIASLHNFGRRPMYHKLGTLSLSRNKNHSLSSASLLPFVSPGHLYTGTPSCSITGTELCEGVAPYDFATIYNVLPLWNAATPIDGTGQTIAIVTDSDLYPQDVSDFRNIFGLPALNLTTINNGPDPGIENTGDELETDIDVELSGAVAKGAMIDLVVSASTNTTAGVDLSALYIVDNDLAPVVSESYGACELELGTAGNQFYNLLWQQAAAEGITAFVAAGDSGAAGCDQDQPIATQGLAVNGIASTPYNVAVGGTDFNDFENKANYWSSTNNPTTEESALGYIPETSWDDTCTNSDFFSIDGVTNAESDCNDSNSSFWGVFLPPVGGGGGASSCTSPSGTSVASCAGGYPKPLWQSGAGVPTDGKRDVPDVSLFAGGRVNGDFYVVCQNNSCADGDIHDVIVIDGTSASAPEFAGIMAMVNQKMQSRQGNANYVFYPLAAQTGSSCDSTGTPASSCIFYDVTVGTNAMACTTGTPNCVTNTNGDQNGVLSGYSTTAGYDQATGLGSVNVTNLVDNWSSISFQPTTATLSLSPTTITHGSAVNVNIGVRPESGSGTPTGLVSLITSAGPSAGVYTLSDGSVASTTTVLPGGSYTVTAHYAGDGTYAATESSPAIKVKVNAEPSVTAMQAFTLDQNGNVVPYTTGTYGASVIYLGTSVAGQSSQGVPTGTVSLSQTLNGVTTSLPGNPYPLNNQAYTMTPLPGAYYTAFTPGMYSFAAEYSGDASFNASNSSPMSFTVTQAQTNVTLTVPGCGSVLCVYSPNTTVSFIASIPYSSSEIISNQPTGTVTFFSNGNSLGSFPVISGLPPVADFSTNQLVGTNNVTAQYSGDTNYLGSTSSPVVVQVGGNFSISANPSVITIGSPGQSGSTTLTFNTQQGFTGSTNLAPYMCTSLPPQSSCSFSPTALAFTPSITSVPVTLTISTTGVSSALGPLRLDPRTWLGSSKVVLFWTSVICILLVISLRKNRGQPIAVFALIVMVTIGISCGGGGGPNGGSGSGGTGGTPTGNYQGVTVTVIVNGITQSISNLSVDVQ